MSIQLPKVDDALAERLAAQPPYADDDAECLIVDLAQGRDAKWCRSPHRLLAALIHDDRFWAIATEARRRRNGS